MVLVMVLVMMSVEGGFERLVAPALGCFREGSVEAVTVVGTKPEGCVLALLVAGILSHVVLQPLDVVVVLELVSALAQVAAQVLQVLHEVDSPPQFQVIHSSTSLPFLSRAEPC